MNQQEAVIEIAKLDKELSEFRSGLKMPMYKDAHLTDIRDRLMKVSIALNKLSSSCVISVPRAGERHGESLE